ncbi:hypothetical protein FGB62_179g02 [Gracilaria domingensis]|nr:hypothetical protein FGB62_179g02 [Gracilaria domingensis]
MAITVVRVVSGKITRGDSEKAGYLIEKRNVVTDRKSYSPPGRELFDATLQIPMPIGDVEKLIIDCKETERGDDRSVFHFSTKDFSVGDYETKYDSSEARGTYYTYFSQI